MSRRVIIREFIFMNMFMPSPRVLRQPFSVAMPNYPTVFRPEWAAGRLGIPFLVLLLFSLRAVTSLNICDYNDIVADVRAQLPTGMAVGGGEGGGGGGRPGGGGGGGPGGRGRKLAQMSARGDAIGGLVRLSFHDSGTWSQSVGNGGPDGCLLLEEPDNGGISEIMAGAEDVFSRWSDRISRADFWALAANAALIDATPNGAITDIPFRWGRKDASVCDYDVGRLPDSEQGYNHVMSWAVDQLGFTTRETVALMGAHTLGRAQPANSGYDGAWVPGDAAFDNQYYIDMIDIPWVQMVNDFRNEGIDRLTHQWNANGLMMLNTDMALGFDLGADDPNAVNHPPCGGGRNRCSTNVPTRSIVDEFAASNQAFYDAFIPAWVKMQELGLTSTLQDISQDCSIPSVPAGNADGSVSSPPPPPAPSPSPPPSSPPPSPPPPQTQPSSPSPSPPSPSPPPPSPSPPPPPPSPPPPSPSPPLSEEPQSTSPPPPPSPSPPPPPSPSPLPPPSPSPPLPPPSPSPPSSVPLLRPSPSPPPPPESPPTEAPTPAPTDPPSRRQETLAFKMQFDSLDATILDDEIQRSRFEAEYLAVIYREARKTFEASVETVMPEDQELLTVRIIRIFTGSVFVETEVDFPPRSSVTSVGGETFAASLEAEPAAVFNTSPTLLSYGPAAADVEISVTEVPDEAPEAPAPMEPATTEGPDGLSPSPTVPADDDTTSSPTPTPTTPAPTPEDSDPVDDPSDGHRTATLIPHRHIILLPLGMLAALLLLLG